MQTESIREKLDSYEIPSRTSYFPRLLFQFYFVTFATCMHMSIVIRITHVEIYLLIFHYYNRRHYYREFQFGLEKNKHT